MALYRVDDHTTRPRTMLKLGANLNKPIYPRHGWVGGSKLELGAPKMRKELGIESSRREWPSSSIQTSARSTCSMRARLRSITTTRHTNANYIPSLILEHHHLSCRCMSLPHHCRLITSMPNRRPSSAMRQVWQPLTISRSQQPITGPILRHTNLLCTVPIRTTSRGMNKHLSFAEECRTCKHHDGILMNLTQCMKPTTRR